MKINIKKIVSALILLFIIITGGCIPSSKTVTKVEELQDAQIHNQPIRLLTTDSKTYTLDQFSINNESISGSGHVNDGDVEKSFNGDLPFSDIIFIERLKPSFWQGFWIVPASLGVGAGLASLLQPQEFTIERVSGSCPFIYSYDGSEYHLEAEAFSTSISKALEAQTYHHLPSLKSQENKLKIRIANERPETHIFNSIQLYAVDSHNVSSIVLDNKNRAWPISNRITPVTATDHFGQNILKKVSTKDKQYWKTNYKNVYTEADFRDELTLSFDIPDEQSTATFIVEAINSDLINDVYSAAGAIIGEESLNFYNSLENNPALKNFFLRWIEKSSLKIELLTTSGWEKAGSIRPEANEVSFQRAIRIGKLENARKPLTIRVSSLMDVWHIDALSIDLFAKESLKMHPLEMTLVKASNKQVGHRKAIGAIDTTYSLLMPADYLDIEFDASQTLNMQNPQYIFSARGYLYEWFPKVNNPFNSNLTEWFKDVNQQDKIALFNQNEDLFLYGIYSHRNKSH